MRRVFQYSGAEIIHLGHNRSVNEIVNCAIQEDAHAIAITSYQGGHMEFFNYMLRLLKEKGAGHIRIFGGGGGTILPEEIKELHALGILRIYSPDDGRTLGLNGMVEHILKQIDMDINRDFETSPDKIKVLNHREIGKMISFVENHHGKSQNIFKILKDQRKNAPVLGITGTGGSGKSSIIDEIVRNFLSDFKKKTVGIISVDPTKRKSGGSLLGDRIRMNSINNPRVYMRSMATRQTNVALSSHVPEVIHVLKSAGFDLIIIETSGIGQSDTEIVDISDISVYVMTPEYGAPTQLEKIDMMDYADIIVLNKADKSGADDALRDIKKQYRRNHQMWDIPEDEIPVFGTTASQFDDQGIKNFYIGLLAALNKISKDFRLSRRKYISDKTGKQYIIPPKRDRYLSEISEIIRNYNGWVKEKCEVARDAFAIKKTIEFLDKENDLNADLNSRLSLKLKNQIKELGSENYKLITRWPKIKKKYKDQFFNYSVRGKSIKINTSSKSLANLDVPKISLPSYEGWNDILRWQLQENLPGEFPYTAGVFPFKRESEDPTRMFAGEGEPERTNRRFHYLCRNQPSKRLSTAFDSVTLYGEDPDRRPDIYGKVGNSGVSICSLDDIKKLYSGLDLADENTSVSMTINGPASILCAMLINAAIDQQCEKYILSKGMQKKVESAIDKKFEKAGMPRPEYNDRLPEGHKGLGLMLLGITGQEILPEEIYEKIKMETISKVRGTVQADILKEDQAQNTCIFSTDFSLRLMGDVQQYFVNNHVRNFYSVSISGYHIAEAGANPVTQLAFTLANGFTYLEYYISRGMKVNDFAPNFSFFFSNGIDPEYAVIGRVARRIWAKAIKLKYRGNERAQKLKYHIQTSGRSLHAQEIDFNDIRTTLQALYAIYDNCNSLHTNAYDEAITTPTEESVRRALAIQLIINRELGLAKNENPLQGSFIIEELTDLVEEAVLAEFDRITERGGVLGAMETMYQRGKIQEESLLYETRKHSGDYPIVGVNTFLSSGGSPTMVPNKITRADKSEKDRQINNLDNFKKINSEKSKKHLQELSKAVISGKNTFDNLMDAVKYCSLGQITHTLFEVGGQYRRNM
jgi:methylmalonyl-CoA mutase